MRFTEELSSMLARMDGSLAAILMGMDGIVVAQAQTKEMSIAYNDVAVECSGLLKEALRISQGNDLGEVHEVVVSSGKLRLILRLLTRDYFVALLLESRANVGKSRYRLRLASTLLAQAL